ncbi:hypothetical protein JCM8097_006987 [Rhodosporidiobolus ruineniae]
MAQAQGSLAQRLRANKEAFLSDLNQGNTLDNWVVSVGNEAGDLDSLASSLAYAYFGPQSDSSSSRRYVPLTLTARADLVLRPENTEALKRAEVPEDALLTLDDLPASNLSSLGTSFALVDHNVLLPMFRSHPDQHDHEEDDRRVVAVVDHHADEQRHLEANPRLIQVVGSCASLVTKLLTADFAPPSPESPIPTGIADLLLSAIMIDTGLKPEEKGGKATAIDQSAVQALLPFSSFLPSSSAASVSASFTTSSPSEADLASALSALQDFDNLLFAKKKDVSWMSGRDLLRRDYKEYLESGVRYGLSTVPLSLSVWLDKSPAEDKEKRWELVLADVEAWMKERDLQLAGVLTSYEHIKKSGKEGKHRRELLLVAAPSAVSQLKSVFEGVERDEVLQLEEWKGLEEYGAQEGQTSEGGRWRVWQQGNAKATRKQVAPALKDLVVKAAGGQS